VCFVPLQVQAQSGAGNGEKEESMNRRQFFGMTGISRRIIGAALFVFSIGFTARADSEPAFPVLAKAEAQSDESRPGSEPAFSVLAKAEAKSDDSRPGSEPAFSVLAKAEAKSDESRPVLAKAEAKSDE
jgi:hypothetical protein